MAPIKQWMDLSEEGSYASLLASGWQDGLGADVVASPHFTDIAGNGGAYSLVVSSYQFGDRYVASPTLSVGISSFYHKFHFRFANTLYGSFTFFKWRSGGTTLGRLVVNIPSGTITMQTGEGTTTLGTSFGTLTAGVWYTIEVHIVIGNSGQYELKVNGFNTNWIPLASGDTQPGSETTVDNVAYYINAGPAGEVCYYDDIEADDAAYPGEGIATIHVPTGAGNTTQLTPSTGANWQCVDEVPPDDTDYVSTDTANKKDTYVHSALPAAASNIKSVLTVARVARAGSGITHAYLVTRSGGTDYESSAQEIQISPGPVSDLRTVDPATGVAWTRTGFNATEVGVRVDA